MTSSRPFYTDFQNHYYAQIKRYYDDRENDRATGDHRQIPLPLDDPEQTHF
jgi:hypothetical protein